MCRKRYFSVLVALTAVVGCSRSELAPLTGKITLDGETPQMAVITFHNQSGGPSGYGNLLSDGSYIAKTGSQEGLKPGDYLVTAIVQEPVVITSREKAIAPKKLSPDRYADPQTSGLKYTLPAEGGMFDISLESN